MNHTATNSYYDSSKSSDDTYDSESMLLLRALFGEILTAREGIELDRYLFLQRYPMQ